MEWVKQTYNKQYENWVPWLEDKYLAWFGENKTSYVAKGMSLLGCDKRTWRCLELHLVALSRSSACNVVPYA